MMNSNDELDDVVGRLDELADGLNKRTFPGRAWEIPVNGAARLRDGGRSWRRWRAPLTAAAAVIVIALVVRFFELPQRQAASLPPVESSTAALAPNHLLSEEPSPIPAAFGEDPLASEPFVNIPFDD